MAGVASLVFVLGGVMVFGISDPSSPDRTKGIYLLHPEKSRRTVTSLSLDHPHDNQIKTHDNFPAKQEAKRLKISIPLPTRLMTRGQVFAKTPYCTKGDSAFGILKPVISTWPASRRTYW